MARLGCGINRAFITGHCRNPRICDLGESASQINWGRKLDNVSEATVTVPIGGTGDDACCECLGKIEPWCHELIITRDGEIVWEGPVTNVEYGYNEVVIEAKDVSYWMSKSVPNVAQVFTLQNLSDIAQTYLNTAYAQNEPGLCILTQVVNSPTNSIQPGSRNIPALKDTWLKYWLDLAETGLDFTVVNRSIIFGDTLIPNRRIGVLTDELIIGEVKLTKSGDLAANRWYVNWATAPPASTPESVSSEADVSCYGRLEGVKDFSDINNVENAQSTADAYVAATEIAPRLLEFPDGSRIHPDAPWALSDMIPGVRFDVALSRLCISSFQAFRLTEVNVSQSGDGDEEITVVLSPLTLGTGTI